MLKYYCRIIISSSLGIFSKIAAADVTELKLLLNIFTKAFFVLRQVLGYDVFTIAITVLEGGIVQCSFSYLNYFLRIEQQSLGTFQHEPRGKCIVDRVIPTRR